MKLKFFVNDKDPREAAELIKYRAMIKLQRRVYVRAYLRVGPWQ